MQKSNNQTYIYLYTDLLVHKYICDRSLSGDPFHIENPFLSANGLSSVTQHTFPTKSQFVEVSCHQRLSFSEHRVDIPQHEGHGTFVAPIMFW